SPKVQAAVTAAIEMIHSLLGELLQNQKSTGLVEA
ncbi:MAG: hypothetical protein JWQ04_172, partial [Pedosphaera sp.]|nr:hypothetical protein [Pedosphaera sp.]